VRNGKLLRLRRRETAIVLVATAIPYATAIVVLVVVASIFVSRNAAALGGTAFVGVLVGFAAQADESIPAPKGRESRTPTDFPLHNSLFQRPRQGAIIAILDPCQADAVSVGEGHAPVVAVPVPAVKKADESIAAPKGRGPPDHAAFPPANRPSSGDRRKGP
jgi:hypothetical protein